LKRSLCETPSGTGETPVLPILTVFAGEDVAFGELDFEGFEGHGIVVIHEGFADSEEFGLRCDAADFVEETAFGIDVYADEVGVFLHLLHLGGFAEVLRRLGGFEQVAQVVENIAALWGENWLTGEVFADLAEEPWVADGAATDHQAAGVGDLQDFLGFGGAVDVAVGENGAWDGLDGAGDEVVMDFAAIHLSNGAGVDGEEVDLMLREDGEEFVEDVGIVEADAGLNCKRNGDGLSEGAEDGIDALGFTEEAAAGAFAIDDGRGAAEV